ncbi:cytochrome c oxidase subunit II, partial [Erythrobacter litoralis]|uniref:cytochrome c oxidase subunit II n=1 Tax=Erythrobacter litoralis TaxID=39960 RepID=UPI002434AE58
MTMQISGSLKELQRIAVLLAAAVLLVFAGQSVSAQEPLQSDDLVAPIPAETPAAALEGVDREAAADVADPDAVAPGSGAYTKMRPEAGKGQPVYGDWNVQNQFSETGRFADGLHVGLIWVMLAISAFVLALLVYVVVRFNKRANPVPSKTSHNTLVEVVWTVVPALILLGIAIPSITLIAKQYKAPPKDAITIKATGYQWYWGYSYPDNGDFEIISNMLTKEEADAAGEPHQLGVDNRMVVPVGVPIRLQTTGADVIHSFAVPSLWFKLDAVPGRLNEKMLQIDQPGVYYGQCSELCGARHAYMPIAVEALPMDQYNAWVLAQGGSIAGADEEGVEANPSAAPIQEPESAVPGAAGGGSSPAPHDP